MHYKKYNSLGSDPLATLTEYTNANKIDLSIDMQQVGNLNMFCAATLRALKDNTPLPTGATINNN